MGLAELFHGYKAKAGEPFVIASEQLKPAAKPAEYTRYPADLMFSALVDWRKGDLERIGLGKPTILFPIATSDV